MDGPQIRRPRLRPIGPAPMTLTKLTVARAQLVTALDMFVRNKDPVSIQCLACGGGEITEALAEGQGEESFVSFIISDQPHMDRKQIRKVKNQYWNAFKHATTHKGMAREDDELLAQFSDLNNDVALFLGWWDYIVIQKRLPIAAQVFQAWWFALNEDKVAPDADLSMVRTAFPDIRRQPRTEQKRRLRRSIEKYRNNREIISDPATEVD